MNFMFFYVLTKFIKFKQRMKCKKFEFHKHMLWVSRPPGMSQARGSKLPFSMGGPGPLSNTWFLGPPSPNTPNGISICSSVFAQRRSQPTDRPRHSVCGFYATGNESVPIQMAQCRFSGLARSNAKILIFFQTKHAEAILSNSTRKLLWFEITEMPIAVQKTWICCVFYYNFPHTIVPYAPYAAWKVKLAHTRLSSV